MLHSSIVDIGKRLRGREITSTQLTVAALDRIEAVNAQLNAFITVTSEQALEAAHKADQDFADQRDRGPLQGIPIALKDNIATKGIRTTCGSRLYGDWLPDHDATVVRKLGAAGAVLLGKTSMHELAYGTTSMNAFFGNVDNPVAPGRDPGGSSGGSAAAVAAGLAFASLGTDTACSIRHPAHCCGVVGFKPSFGRISTAGVMPLVRSLDHVGPFTRSVMDAALITEAIAGYDPLDPHSADYRWCCRRNGARPIAGLRIGVARQFFFRGDAEIIAAVDRVLSFLREAGAHLVEVGCPEFERSLHLSRMAFVEAHAEFSDRLALRWDEFSGELQAKLTRYGHVTSRDYILANHERAGFRRFMHEMMRSVDVILAPTSSVLPAPHAQRPDDYDQGASRNATVFNLTGQPSISIPCGWTAGGLPVGLMISGALGGDQDLLDIAAAIEGLLKPIVTRD